MKNTDKLPEDAPAEIPESVIRRLDPVVLEIFSRGDFHRVDMRSIARQAGMSFTTIYRHYSDKESLLFWFIAHWLKDLQASAVAALDGGAKDSSLELMRKYLITHFRYYQARPDVGRIIFMTVPLERWMQDATYTYQEPTRKLLGVIRAGQKAGEIRGDVSAVAIADLLSGVFNRAFLMWEFRGRTYSLVDQAEEMISLITCGVVGPGTSASRVRSKSGTRPPR
jgi:AcrR family transcriptional regulator